MKKTLRILIVIIGISLTLSYVSTPLAHRAFSHSHKYPFTGCFGESHLRLSVDHSHSKMFLVFEDRQERPIKILRLERITGEATLPDGTINKVTFSPTIPLRHKFIAMPRSRHRHMKYRKADTYVSKSGWLTTAESFNLHVVVPFEGKSYEINIEYERENV